MLTSQERFSRIPPLSDTRVVVIYAVSAAAWITLSDRIVAAAFADTGTQAVFATIKGWGFVAATALLLAGLLHRYSSERGRQRAELAQSERQFRLLADRAQDVIFSFRLTEPAGFIYLSPSSLDVLGYSPGEFVDDPGLIARLVHPDDAAMLPSGDPDEFLPRGEAILRVRHRDGRWISLEVHTTALADHGEPILEGVARDVTDRERARSELTRLNRVLRTLGEVNRALVHATTETNLLDDICRIIVEHGGFRFAWVGYADGAEGHLLRPVARSGHEDGYLSNVAIRWDDSPEGRGPAGVSVRESRTVVVPDLASDPMMDPWREHAAERGYASVASFPLRAGDRILGALVIYSGEPNAFGGEEVALFEELAGDLTFGVETLRERDAAAAARAERARLATAVEQSTESVVITDLEGRIEYVNPAFERITGYVRDEVIGRNPRILRSGVQSAAFYEVMWRALLDGRAWASDFVNRRRDGSLFTEEAVISPVHDGEGRPTGYVAVKRDVTRERQAEARAQAQARERALIAEALAAVRPQASAEETAAALCEQVVRLPEATVALLLGFDADGRATPLAGVTAPDGAIDLRPIPEGRATELRSRALDGPWVEGWISERGHPHNRAFHQLGVRGLAYAPLLVEGEVVGLLEFGSADPDAAGRLAERVPALVEFAAIAGAVLGPSLSSRARIGSSRQRVREIIERIEFHPVFQPIIDLESLAVVGYEALTRFDNGTQPDEQFRQAAAAGLGPELEVAALRAAFAAAGALPDAPWLNVNVSPAAILAGEPLRSLLRRQEGAVVLEVTEHEAIGDYPAFRAAVAELGPNVGIAVDDAGAGFASMRHILELRPAFVKIDRSLVAGIEADVARQALLAGLRHFADSLDCGLIAEGIETEPELETLRRLGLRTGQGFLLGRPVPLTDPGARCAQASGDVRPGR